MSGSSSPKVGAYGADVPDIYRRAAGFADKILKGARPADLPVERPTRVEIAVNFKSAKALGVTVPDSILMQAVQIIE
jgi:putative ABC transport system substrate-binding protein